MIIEHMICAFDSHTEGQNTRIIVGGIPALRGKTMWEKREDFRQRFDHIRRALMDEPRGWPGMFGALITSPASEGADFGAIFMDPGGYISGCLHGTIGLSTVAVEIGLIQPVEPETVVKIDTISRLVTARVKIKEGHVCSVSVENVPSFVYLRNAEINVSSLGKIQLDVCFGGNFFAILPAESIGYKLTPENGTRLVQLGMEITEAANKQISVEHPEDSQIKFIDLTEFTGPPTSKFAMAKHAAICCRGARVGAFDRSPCGTGTSAHLALEYAKGNISIGEEFVAESLVGSIYRSKIVGKTKVGNYNAIIPEVTGRAFVTGVQQFIIDKRDPFKYGLIDGLSK